ncbi:MAG: GNAT family N-acetyltransferase [Defluviitaleaceae bacterium]|nr:GNAT family N-acetyltransferase [Defluviitaleaceae bacterium]
MIQRLSKSEVGFVSALAGEIWREHYTPIIGIEQVEYMLEKFQSSEQIYEDITQNNHIYFTFKDCSKNIVAYCAVFLQADHVFLSKLYIHSDFRNKGIARGFLNEAIRLGKSHGLDKICLTVNKDNGGAISAYKKMGFKIVSSCKKDIGGGFFMDDYVMELSKI